VAAKRLKRQAIRAARGLVSLTATTSAQAGRHGQEGEPPQRPTQRPPRRQCRRKGPRSVAQVKTLRTRLCPLLDGTFLGRGNHRPLEHQLGPALSPPSPLRSGLQPGTLPAGDLVALGRLVHDPLNTLCAQGALFYSVDPACSWPHQARTPDALLEVVRVLKVLRGLQLFKGLHKKRKIHSVSVMLHEAEFPFQYHVDDAFVGESFTVFAVSGEPYALHIRKAVGKHEHEHVATVQVESGNVYSLVGAWRNEPYEHNFVHTGDKRCIRVGWS
jgi:hypothetical protein